MQHSVRRVSHRAKMGDSVSCRGRRGDLGVSATRARRVLHMGRRPAPGIVAVVPAQTLGLVSPTLHGRSLTSCQNGRFMFLGVAVVAIWAYLLLGRGGFW